MSNKEILEVINLNKEYEFLMDFIGLQEISSDLGVSYSEDKLDALDCAFYCHLDKEEHEKLSEHIAEVKKGIDLVMDRMQNKVNSIKGLNWKISNH